VRNVLVTAAYLNRQPVCGLAPWIDAANVDIKAMSDAFYRDICGATLAPVLEATEAFKAGGVFLEITHLVIPTLNDSDRQFHDLATWIAGHLGVETPLHLSRFFPVYRLEHLPPTSVATLKRARDIARAEGLTHVYIGNAEVPGGSDTACAGCGAELIRRRHFQVERNRIEAGHCPACGRVAAGIWQ
jgi:pyruvate formate lyase activating enzyme